MAALEFPVGDRWIGEAHPCFIVAEAGVNHNGDLDLARRLVDVAAEAGADAIKFQTFCADRLVSRDAPKAEYQKRTTDAAESQYEMLRRLELSEEAHRELIDRCREKGLLFMSTPFDETAADLLERLEVPIYKTPSGEITNLPYLAHVAGKGRPMIVSTGMSSLGEVEQAVEAIERAGNSQFVLLHCVSNYPADPADVNLRCMNTLAAAFGTLVGYSDHTVGPEAAMAAVALGARVVEKHFTLDRTLPGPDHRASVEPAELAQLVRGIRTVEACLGRARKSAVASERDTAAVARKSLVAAADIPAGTRLRADLIEAKRPGTGLPPSMRPYLLGRRVRRDICAGELLDLEMLG